MDQVGLQFWKAYLRLNQNFLRLEKMFYAILQVFFAVKKVLIQLQRLDMNLLLFFKLISGKADLLNRFWHDDFATLAVCQLNILLALISDSVGDIL